MTNERANPGLVRIVETPKDWLTYQSPVMPSRSIGLLSEMSEQVSAIETSILTFAGRDQIILIILDNRREVEMCNGARMTMTGQWYYFWIV